MNQELKEFINRATKLLEEKVKENDEERKRKQRVLNQKRRVRFLESSKNLKENDWDEIYTFYENCPEGMHVDHIIPLCKGGLHHISNLQYLTPLENLKKGKKIIELTIKCYEED